MPVEVAQYISSLNAAWPATDDFVYEGDNHLRLIRQGASVPIDGRHPMTAIGEEQTMAAATCRDIEHADAGRHQSCPLHNPWRWKPTCTCHNRTPFSWHSALWSANWS